MRLSVQSARGASRGHVLHGAHGFARSPPLKFSHCCSKLQEVLCQEHFEPPLNCPPLLWQVHNLPCTPFTVACRTDGCSGP